MPDFLKLASKIKTEFKDINLLRQACTHRSYLNENKSSGLEHNERLEFLGDAVLELVVTHFLYKKFPGRNEGELTAYRSAIVNTVSLSKAASFMGINEYLLLSKVDQGYDSAEKFIAKFILEVIDIDEIIDKKLWLDAKSRFQEKAQEETGITPTYKTMKETGPDHSKLFTLGVFIGDKQIALGTGMSKQEAEQKAAEKALEVKGW